MGDRLGTPSAVGFLSVFFEKDFFLYFRIALSLVKIVFVCVCVCVCVCFAYSHLTTAFERREVGVRSARCSQSMRTRV